MDLSNHILKEPNVRCPQLIKHNYEIEYLGVESSLT